MIKKLEKEVQREILDWLATQPHLFFWRSNNIPVFDRKGMKFRSLPKYTPRGLPDIFVLCRGMFIGLEVKATDYWKYTDDQALMKKNIEAQGFLCPVVTSLESVKQLFKDHNLI